MVKEPTTQISPLKMRSKNYIGFTSASEAGFTTSKATGTGLQVIMTICGRLCYICRSKCRTRNQCRLQRNIKDQRYRRFIFIRLHFLFTPIQPARAQKVQSDKNEPSVGAFYGSFSTEKNLIIQILCSKVRGPFIITFSC